MIYQGEKIDFPAEIHFSLFKVIESLELLAKGQKGSSSSFAKELLQEINKYPELKTGITDITRLEEYKEPIEKISKYLFPDLLLTNEIKVLTPPFQFTPLYSSTRLENIIHAAEEGYVYDIKDVDPDTFYLYTCYYIMGKYYGYPVHGGSSLKMQILNRTQGILRKYKLLVNADLLEFIPTEKALDITEADFELLMDNFTDIDLWKSKFPSKSWIIKGITLISMVDVTGEESKRAITETLLSANPKSFSIIQNSIRSLLNNTGIDIGVNLYENNRLVTIDKEELSSILLGKDGVLDLNEETYEKIRSTLIMDKKPLIVPDIKLFHTSEHCTVSEILNKTDYKSYIIAPLLTDGEINGFIEFAGKNRYDLNAAVFDLLEDVIPILAMAQQRFITEAQNRIEAVIQQECTTIHPAVKWRFEEEANKFINAQLKDDQPAFKDIIFKDLYPLYGQMDIKSSSSKRNEAVAKDLLKQTEEVNKILIKVLSSTKMPIYEELIQRIKEFQSELQLGVSVAIEHEVLAFLKKEIYPVFSYLEKNQPELREVIDAYNSMLDQELMSVYVERKKYDDSINYINHQLASFLDEKQSQAQEMFPHFFERYKTDGVEYNIYIGQSITKDKKFDLVHLKNLRLWQLIVMCEMENEFKRVKEHIQSEIEMASLILVHHSPLTVHFRMDEKQFDVQGAYNARYEIIKKRVDKAHIKGTQERVTQPGHIAIIYSQDQEAAEYTTYLNFLSAKGLIEDPFEYVDLEDLQGVSGLKAIRIKVIYDVPITVEEFMESMEVD